ncbi:MAG TPA: hypothetical protein VK488_06825 [Gaiellaceae bacterium]|nr:hypothetical protein [Gaiellaceae bacterium]
MFDEIVSIATALGVVGTGLAILIGVRELKQAEEHARTTFEDDLCREYRSILAELPAESFFTDGALPPDRETLRVFYRYVDLSNEQLFLGRSKRVRESTLDEWCAGIRGNLESLPAFQSAWAEIATRVPPDFFKELKALAPPAKGPPSGTDVT